MCVRVCVFYTQRAQEVADEWRAEAQAARPHVNHGPLLPVSVAGQDRPPAAVTLPVSLLQIYTTDVCNDMHGFCFPVCGWKRMFNL